MMFDVHKKDFHFIDMGLSKTIDVVTGEADNYKSFRGTPIYFAPELSKSSNTKESDIYALGRVMLEMIAKKYANLTMQINDASNLFVQIKKAIEVFAAKTQNSNLLYQHSAIMQAFEQIAPNSTQPMQFNSMLYCFDFLRDGMGIAVLNHDFDFARICNEMIIDLFRFIFECLQLQIKNHPNFNPDLWKNVLMLISTNPSERPAALREVIKITYKLIPQEILHQMKIYFSESQSQKQSNNLALSSTLFSTAVTIPQAIDVNVKSKATSSSSFCPSCFSAAVTIPQAIDVNVKSKATSSSSSCSSCKNL
jgi:serine/threonine protein kinase